MDQCYTTAKHDKKRTELLNSVTYCQCSSIINSRLSDRQSPGPLLNVLKFDWRPGRAVRSCERPGLRRQDFVILRQFI